MNRRIALALLCALVSVSGARAESFDVYAFASPEEEARFERLTHELRCPKCQNQSIADSNAPIAQDLRQRTYELVSEGNSDAEIVAYLSERYGDFITYRPPLTPMTLLLWTGPFLLLLVVVVVLLLRRRRLRALPDDSATAPPSAQVSAILSRYDDGGGEGGGGAR